MPKAPTKKNAVEKKAANKKAAGKKDGPTTKPTSMAKPGRATASPPAGLLSVDRAMRYRWRDPEYGFADARERDPRRAVVGLLMSDVPLCGGLTNLYWFASLEQLVAWCVRVVGAMEGVEDYGDDEDDEDLTPAQREERSIDNAIRRLIKAMGPRRRLAPVITWLEEHMSATAVSWSGTFEDLCTLPKGRELRSEFWRSEGDRNCSPRGAPIPPAQRSNFIEWMRSLNE
jgi:hypothetical protein